MDDAKREVVRAIARAFEGLIDPGDADMTRFVATLADCVLVDEAKREIVIDKLAVLQALLYEGGMASDFGPRAPGNAAEWIAEAVATSKIPHRDGRGGWAGGFVRRHDSDTKILPAARDGYAFTFSQSMIGEIIPRAMTIAKMTGRSGFVGIRHLVMAMAYPDSNEVWRSCGFNSKPDVQALIRPIIVSRIQSEKIPGENIKAWAELGSSPTPPPPREKFEFTKFVLTTPPPPPAPPPPPPSGEESTPIHDDAPAEIDALGREGFADALADRIVIARGLARSGSVNDPARDQAFMIHLHGAWGSGKSSVLNFLRKRLETRWLYQLHEPPRADEQIYAEWLVVDFNAWKFQRLSPAWWTMLVQIQKAAEARAPHTDAWMWLKFRWLWLRWKLKTLSALTAGAIILLSLALASTMGLIRLAADAKGLIDAFTGLGGLLGGLGALAGVYAFGRSLVAPDDAVAKLHAETAGDPYAVMIDSFNAVIAGIGKPVIVFIDDLDRCDADYVTTLLESIQTMLRSAPITYLIAADRKWICASFSKRYADFEATDPDAGRPVGYQFLDKLFQISTNLPSLPENRRNDFWKQLLARARNAQPHDSPVQKQEIANTARDMLKTVTTHEEQLNVLQSSAVNQNPQLEEAVRSAFAVRAASATEETRTLHRLEKFGALIEPNPRSMKRLVNAINMSRGRMVLERRDTVSFEAIARWTMLELRWPLLADWLAEKPARIGRNQRADNASVDLVMQGLLKDRMVAATIKGGPDAGRLDATQVVAITG